jgi:hypothetical protein
MALVICGVEAMIGLVLRVGCCVAWLSFAVQSWTFLHQIIGLLLLLELTVGG